MELISKGILFVFENGREYNSDLINFFREKNIYCEPIREENYYEYVEKYNPRIIFFDINVKIGNVNKFELNKNDKNIYETILKEVKKINIERFWTQKFYINYIQKAIIDEFKDGSIPIISLSTGIDSTMLAIFIQNTLKRKIKCLYVDTGLNRNRDIDDLKYLKDNYENLDIEILDISNEIYTNLKTVINQREKKDIIRNIFITNLNTTIEEYVKKKNYKLVEGSIVTDTFKAFIGNKNAIPLIRCLTKEEVKKIAEYLKLDKRLIYKFKFPLIGFAKKIVGEVNKENVRKLAIVDERFCEEIVKKDGVLQNAHYVDVSYMKNDDIDIYVYRVDSRIIKKKIISYEHICNIIEKIQKNYKYSNKSLLDVSNNTDSLLMQR